MNSGVVESNFSNLDSPIISVQTLPPTLEQIAQGSVTDFTNYSRFKYGDLTATVKLSEQLVQHLCERINLFDSKDTYFTSTLMTGTPSASHWLARLMVKLLYLDSYKQKRSSFHYIDLMQAPKPPIFMDYSALPANVRKVSQLSQTKLITPPELSTNSRLVIVNDINVTGNQLDKQREILHNANIGGEVVWLYIYEVDKKQNIVPDPSIENFLNNYGLESTELFVQYMNEHSSLANTLLNKRLILKILTLDDYSRKHIIDKLEKDFISEMMAYSINENMHLNEELFEKLEELRVRIV